MTDDRFIYQCPKCGKRLHARYGNANRKARCPACGEIHVVPSEEDPFAVGQTDLPDDVADTPVESSPFDFFEDAAAQQVASDAAGGAQAHVRHCPRCGRETHVADPWVEAVCRTCGSVVPAEVNPEDQDAASAPQTREPTGEPPLPGAASLLGFVAASLYVEAAIFGAAAVLLLVLEAAQNIVVVIPALAGLLLAGFRAAQAQQISQRNSTFRVIVAASDVLGAMGLLVISVLSIRGPHLMLLPAALWVAISVLFVLLAGSRSYILFHHAKALFTRKPGK